MTGDIVSYRESHELTAPAGEKRIGRDDTAPALAEQGRKGHIDLGSSCRLKIRICGPIPRRPLRRLSWRARQEWDCSGCKSSGYRITAGTIWCNSSICFCHQLRRPVIPQVAFRPGRERLSTSLGLTGSAAGS